MPARITAVHDKGSHSLSKDSVARDPIQPNLRQVHLLLAAVLDRTANGEPVRRAGVMGVVLASGKMLPGDAIHIVEAPVPHLPLRPV